MAAIDPARRRMHEISGSHDSEHSHLGMPADRESPGENVWLELNIYGIEHVLRGSDTGTLVAFAALTFQQIRGAGEPHQRLGCGILLFSVLMCAIVHFAIGNAYVGRAKLALKQRKERRREVVIRRVSYLVAWLSTFIQFVCITVGSVLVLIEKPSAMLVKFLLPLFDFKL